MSDRGKMAGGAAVGAGGILAVILKSGSAEMHAVEGATQAARAAHAAEGIGQVGARAGGAAEGLGQAGARGARYGAAGAEGAGAVRGVGLGVAAAAEHGAPSIERAALASASDRALVPLEGAAANAGTKAGTTGTKAGQAATHGVAPSARAQKVHDILEHAEDAKDLLENLSDVWDLSQNLDDDDDEKVTAKFEKMGLDFHGDVVPSFRGEAAPGLPGAKRELLTDGRDLVPAFKLAGFPPTTHAMDQGERMDAALAIAGRDASVALYAEPLGGGGARVSSTGTALVYGLAASKDVTWSSVAADDLRVVPRLVDVGRTRYAAVVPAPIHRDRPVTRLIFVTRRP